MTEKRRSLILSLLILGAVALMAAGYIHSRKPVEITMSLYTGNSWGVPQNFAYAIYDKGAEMFLSEPGNEEISIEYKTGNLYRYYSEWLAQKILTGNEPDLFLMVEEDFNTYASIGLLENLSPYLDEDQDFRRENYHAMTLKAGSFRGSQYSLPISVVPSFLIVNRTLLEKNGITIDRDHWDWQQFYEICRSLSRDLTGDGMPDQFGVYGYDWQQALYSSGTALLSPDSYELAFDDRRMEETLEFLKKMHSLTKGKTVSDRDFERGIVGFRVFNFSEYRTYSSFPYSAIRYTDFDWEAIPMPSGPGGRSSSKLYTVQVAMSSRSRHKKEAYEYMKYLASNPEFQKEIWHMTNNLPANRKVISRIYAEQQDERDSSKMLSIPFLDSVINSSYIDPNFKWYKAIDEYVDQKIFTIVAKDQDIPGGIKELRRELESKLLEYR